jgi:hypothetical protein
LVLRYFRGINRNNLCAQPSPTQIQDRHVRTINWRTIANRAKCAEAEAELILEKAWEEIVEEAWMKAVEEKARQLRAAWPRLKIEESYV